MNRDIRKAIYFIITIFIIFIIMKAFLKLLPIILILGVIGYIVFKVKKFLINKKVNSELKNNIENASSEHSFNAYDDYTSSEVIDVEYEEVDAKQSKK